jgi:hypothetical protein
MCRFSDAGIHETIHALWRPAFEKRQGTKSRWVGYWRCRGFYGDLTAACGLGKFVRSGRLGRFASKNGCGCGPEGVDCALGDRIGDAASSHSGAPTQAGELPAEGRREWRVSLRWWMGGDIMRCRS